MMNKYTVITFSILTGLLLLAILLFDFEFRWWYLVILYAISRYNGTVQQSTKQGFNITNISFEGLTNEQRRQGFIVEIIVDAKGNTKTIRGNFINDLSLDVKDLRTLLFTHAKRNSILPILENDQSVTKNYPYRNKNISIEFENVLVTT